VPEGHVHVALVDLILRAIAEERGAHAVFTDRAGERAQYRSPNLGGYVPDVYAVGVRDDDRRDVGEAKSAGDLAAPRTVLQLRAFLGHLVVFDKPRLLVAVPFIAVPAAFGMLARLVTPETRHVNVVVLAPHVRRVVAAGWTV